MFKETVDNREKLTSAMDALDRLGKSYKVTKRYQQPDWLRGISGEVWDIEEVESSSLITDSGVYTGTVRATQIVVRTASGGDVDASPR